ncbi:MAG: hypothetical protein LKJ69_07340 [Lactobacillus sp.]|jgi:hypothetical protein|nr:hypothetical protein [Lactobacillus sp.]MCI2033205.1 hypothetical protein [Lactobacillus sp.]
MKTRYIVMILVGIPLALLTVGSLATDQTPAKLLMSKPGGPGIVDQREYLQKHEAELVAAVKRMNPKITSVQFDWSTVETGDIGNGTPQGGGKVIDVYGKFNHIKGSGFILQMDLTDAGMPDLKRISVPTDFRVRKGDKVSYFD